MQSFHLIYLKHRVPICWCQKKPEIAPLPLTWVAGTQVLEPSLLTCSANGHNSPEWAKPSLEPGPPPGSPMWVQRPGDLNSYLPRCIIRELKAKHSSWDSNWGEYGMQALQDESYPAGATVPGCRLIYNSRRKEREPEEAEDRIQPHTPPVPTPQPPWSEGLGTSLALGLQSAPCPCTPECQGRTRHRCNPLRTPKRSPWGPPTSQQSRSKRKRRAQGAAHAQPTRLPASSPVPRSPLSSCEHPLPLYTHKEAQVGCCWLVKMPRTWSQV